MLKKSLAAAAVAAASGAVLFGATPAYAAAYPYSDVIPAGNGGSVSGGNGSWVDSENTTNGCGNSSSTLGTSGAGCQNNGVMINTD
ncbi:MULTISPECIES: DUF320 domain-containing protein [Streptomonospora]|uniref:DUF320 domain-containing protein n=2 Tax=Streptomonospora TaxID=104204 RepID=A0ABV9SU27_9ACTN